MTEPRSGKSADADLTWDQRILDVMPPGVDEHQLDEKLRLTPTERIEKLERFLADLHELRPGLSK
ncbi:MAG: hypothetical protein ACO1OB_17330 [Archangium sp.]